MPIQLTTTKSPGYLDEGKTYTHLKIIWFKLDLEAKIIEARYALGYMDGDNFIEGVGGRKTLVVENVPASTDENGDPVAADPAFDDLITENQTTYDAAASAIYQVMIDREIEAGTIV